MFRAEKGMAKVEVDYKNGQLIVEPRPAGPNNQRVCTTIASSLTLLLGFYLKEKQSQEPYIALVGYFEQHGWKVTELGKGG